MYVIDFIKPQDLNIKSSLDEIFSTKEDASHCYFQGMRYSYNRYFYAPDKEKLSQQIQTVEIPKLYICKEHDVVFFSNYTYKNKSNLVNLNSLPVWASTKEPNKHNIDTLFNFYGLYYDPDNRRWFANETQKFKSVEGPCFFKSPTVFLGSHTDDAFSHFIFETLAKLFLIPEDVISTCFFLVSDHIKNYQMELLALAGISSERIIRLSDFDTSNVVFSELITISWPSHNNAWTVPAALHYLKRLFSSNFSDIDPATIEAKLAYFDRQDERSEFRSIINEPEVLQMLQENYQADIHTLGKLGFMAKYEVFNRYKSILGQYGGGMQICFMGSPQATFIVLQSNSFNRPHIDFMASVLGLRVVNFLCDTHKGERRANANIEVMVEDLKLALSHYVL